jgi:hypothetical protein
MTHHARLLPALYAACALVLAWCSASAYQHGRPGYALLLAALAVTDLVAAGHCWHQRDELRSALIRAERAARPFTTAQDQAVADLMSTDCCERWWTSAGAEHDTDHCTRKDHHA